MKSNKPRYFIAAVIVIILFVVAASLGSCDKVKHMYESRDVVESNTVEQFEEFPPTTVQEVLQRRNDMLHLHFVDSTFMNMKEEILINILVNKGTLLSEDEIVSEYISKKEYYDNLLRQINIQKQYIPDSIPKSSQPESIKNDSVVKSNEKGFNNII